MPDIQQSEKVDPEQAEFSYCVGRPWPTSKAARPSTNNICVYSYGTQVHCGTMADAETLRKHVNERTGEENFIYKLVKI